MLLAETSRWAGDTLSGHPKQPLTNTIGISGAAPIDSCEETSLIRRFILYLLGYSIVLGAMYGSMVLGFEDNDYALYTFKYVFPIFVAISLLLAYLHSDSEDALWSALEKDYSKVGARPDQMPMSGGLFGSSDLDDLGAAKSYADDDGITVCRVEKKDKIGPCIRIRWDQIESVEIIEPDEEFIEPVASEYSRKAAAALLSAKLKLRRKRKAMTLVVPWHEQFARHAPPSIEIIKDWDWPFAVM